jgi:4'-phosphopantetheinyl transferase
MEISTRYLNQFQTVFEPEFCLGERDIHVWCADLDSGTGEFEEFWRILSEEEQARATRFHFAKDRRRFILCRGFLRTLLANYLSTLPSRVPLCYGKKGKPQVTDGSGKTKVKFNLSRSAGVAVYAFSRNNEIGVDIEHIRDIPEMEETVERFFSIRENDVFYSLPSSEKRQAFYACWTRKEAYVKAVGEGLFYPLNGFDVSFSPNQPARLLSIDGDPEKASQWFMLSLKPAAGFAGALAVKGQDWRPHFFQWPDRTTSDSTYQQRVKWLSVQL